MPRPLLISKKISPFILLIAVIWLHMPLTVMGQYFRFGKNKIQYSPQNWSYLQSDHFDIFYYDGAEDLAQYTAQVAENAYQDTRVLFQHELTQRVPILIYQGHNDFVVTNAVDLPIYSEGISGVTEPYKNRIALPFVGDYRQYRHTLHHELIHAVINDVYFGGALESFLRPAMRLNIPHWFNEGLAEYAAEGWSSDADDWLRDATLHDDVPDIQDIYGFASYQAGQGVWDYIAEQYGRGKIGEILQRLRVTHAFEGTFEQATGLSLSELSNRWRQSLKQIHYPELTVRQDFMDYARPVITLENGGLYNTSPALSPKGDQMAFISTENGLFDVYLADPERGEVLRRLIKGQTSAEFESLRILTPGLCWSPDGKFLALAVKSGSSDAIAILNVESGESRQIRIPRIDQILSLSWNPKYEQIAFSASFGSQSDIFVLDMSSGEISNYTDDVFSDHEPSWSPDGEFILFHSDRGAQTMVRRHHANTFEMANHDYSQYDIYRLVPGARFVERLTFETQWDDKSPQFANDPGRLLFLSDRNGILNLYEKDLINGETRPVTNSLTGITQYSLSRDGSKAAILGLKEGTPQIYLVRTPFTRALNLEELEPSIWAQRVLQDRTPLAPALALANPDLQISNPFIRDALDGIPYIRGPRPSPELLASRSRALEARRSNTPPASSEEEPFVARSTTMDTTRYGNVRVNFRDYIFSNVDEEDEADLQWLLNPFDVEDNIAEDGRFKEKKYKLRFSPDLVYGTAGYDALFGVQGFTQITFSDMLGNHRVFVASNLLIDLRNSDYMLSYTYLPRQIDWQVAGFHVSRLLPDNTRQTIYRYRQYGGGVAFSYPLDKFRRLDLDLSIVGVSQADIVEPSIPSVTRTLFYPALTYTRDVTTPGMFYPIAGNRWALRLSGSPGGFSAGTVQFISLLSDVRTYTSFGRGRYSIALRGSAGTSFGPAQQLFYAAGVQNWLNRRFDDENGFPIEDISDFIFATPIMPLRGYNLNARNGSNFGLVNFEVRFPLVNSLVPRSLPIIPIYNIQGTLFSDVGAIWGGRGLNNAFNVFKDDESGMRVLDDMLVSAGVGLRGLLFGYPVRMDLAWPHDGQEWKRYSLHFSVGLDF